MNAIEGVDYIFDRYAYLNIPMTADEDTIRTAIRTLRASVHEVRLQGAHAELQAKAKDINEIAARCAAMLLDKDKKPLYDAKLQEFKENNPDLISTDGRPMILLNSDRVDLDDLLSEHKADLKKMEVAVQAHCGYNPKQLANLRDMATAAPDNEIFQDLYRKQLEAQLVWATVMEGQAWRICGITNEGPEQNAMTHADTYSEHNEALITNYREEKLPRAVALRGSAVAIGMAQPPLLLGFSGGKDVDSPDIVEQTEMTEAEVLKQAQERFDSAARAIRDYSAVRQQALTELINTAPVTILHLPHEVSDGPRTVFLLKAADTDDGEPELLATFNFIAKGSNLAVDSIDMASNLVTLSQLKTGAYSVPTAAVIHHNEVRGFYLEPIHAVEVMATRQLKQATPPKLDAS